MLARFPIYAFIATKDIERARRWYAEKLGFEPAGELPDGLVYKSGGTQFMLYQSTLAGSAQNTVAAFEVTDLDAVMADLRGRGVVFEEYNFPDFKTVNGVASLEGLRSAWFKDGDGNIFALNQMG